MVYRFAMEQWTAPEVLRRDEYGSSGVLLSMFGDGAADELIHCAALQVLGEGRRVVLWLCALGAALHEAAL